MGRRPQVAEDLLSCIAGYLRPQFRPPRPFIGLADELQEVLAYVAIERVRLGSRLRLEVVCPPDTAGALVPPLSLQPLVENAIRHGVARSIAGARVRISARIRGGDLLLAVADDGPGTGRSVSGVPGWGLVGLRLRLDALYGPSARLRILSRPGYGTIAAIHVPAAHGVRRA
jgi:two-component system LytT family sensor kinase